MSTDVCRYSEVDIVHWPAQPMSKPQNKHLFRDSTFQNNEMKICPIVVIGGMWFL